MSKAREFWIEKEHWQKWYGGIKKYLSCFEEAQNEVDEYYHVIEYSEVERLKSENEDLKSRIDKYWKECDRFESENQRLKKIESLYKELCDDWNEDCKDDCSSWGHSDDCENISIAALKRALKSENKKLKEAAAILEEALGLYENPFNYLDQINEKTSIPDFYKDTDFGMFADEALKKYKEMMGE